MYSKEYQEQQRELHKDPNYGVKGIGYLGPINMAIKGLQCESVLDYGCGPHARLRDALTGVLYYPFDIVEPYNNWPPMCDLVVAADVLEHVEPEHLDSVLEHISTLAMKGVFLSVHTAEAKKTLPDGRNAHLIIEPAEWWWSKISERFEIHQFMRVSDREFFVIAVRRENAGT
jgi:hypothetical protein